MKLIGASILFSAVALVGAQHPQPSGNQYGSIQIRAIGDTGREKYTETTSAITNRQETMDAEFTLTFTKDKSGHSVATVSATKFKHDIIYDRTYKSMPGSYKTTTHVELDTSKDDPTIAATAAIVRIGGTRMVRLSFSEPYAPITGKITTVSAYGLGKPTTTVSPVSSKQERLFLDLDWSKAGWSSDYDGVLAMVPDKYYIDPCTEKPWLMVRYRWTLSPFPPIK